VLLAASFAYIGVYLVGPGHVVGSYVQWGYPPWAHFVAGALFLSAAMLLPFPRTCWPGLPSPVVLTPLIWPAPAIVHDIKGDNWTFTAGWRVCFGRALLFDPTNTVSTAYNPLLEVGRGE